jgi:hypothetical protein
MNTIEGVVFICIGLVIGQVWVHFALEEFFKEHGGKREDDTSCD